TSRQRIEHSAKNCMKRDAATCRSMTAHGACLWTRTTGRAEMTILQWKNSAVHLSHSTTRRSLGILKISRLPLMSASVTINPHGHHPVHMIKLQKFYSVKRM